MEMVVITYVLSLLSNREEQASINTICRLSTNSLVFSVHHLPYLPEKLLPLSSEVSWVFFRQTDLGLVFITIC